MGNVTNNDNRQIVIFNYYYLEHKCKDAETIHDFIPRYAIKCGDFFRENATGKIGKPVYFVVSITLQNTIFYCTNFMVQYYLAKIILRNGGG